MLTFGSVVIGVRDVAPAVEFWMAALDYARREEPSDVSGDESWAVLLPREGVGPQVTITLSTSDPQDNPRVHIDLYADDRQAEVERLIALGATAVDQDAHNGGSFEVMADLDGNRFCVIDLSA